MVGNVPSQRWLTISRVPLSSRKVMKWHKCSGPFKATPKMAPLTFNPDSTSCSTVDSNKKQLLFFIPNQNSMPKLGAGCCLSTATSQVWSFLLCYSSCRCQISRSITSNCPIKFLGDHAHSSFSQRRIASVSMFM